MGDWCNTFLSLIGELIVVGIGVYGGYRFGLKQDRKLRREDERKRKEDIIKSLIAEIADNERALEDGLKEEIFSDSANVVYLDGNLSADAFDSNIFSGGYQLLTVETQRHTTWFFNGCKRMNQLLDRLGYSGISESEVIFVSSEISRIYSGLGEGASNARSRLEKELGYTWAIDIIEGKYPD